MAITLSSFPNLLSSAYRPVDYVVTSDAGTIVRMKAQLKVDGVNSGQPDVLDPDLGTSNRFTFDFQDACAAVMDGYLNNRPTIGEGELSGDANNSITIEVEFTELLTAILNAGATLTTSEGVVVITGVPQHEENQDLGVSFGFKQGVSDTQRRFLTNYSTNSSLNITNKEIGINESEFTAGYFNTNLDTTGYTSFSVSVATRDILGSIIQLAAFDISDLGSELQSDIPTGATNLNDATLTVGSQPLITDQVATYSLFITGANAGTQTISETLTYKLVGRILGVTRLCWVNELGGLDFFTFTGTRFEAMPTDRTSYRKALSNNFSIPERGFTNIGSVSTETYTIESQALKKDIRRWLKGMIDSSLVYWIKDGSYVPVTISGSDAQIIAKDPRFTFSFAKANNRVRQRN